METAATTGGNCPHKLGGALHIKSEERNSPPWLRRGGRDIKKMSRSSLVGADGAVRSNYRLFHHLNQPPRLRGFGRFATFLDRAATPPWLRRGVCSPNATLCVKPRTGCFK